jgi:hypothetical protein
VNPFPQRIADLHAHLSARWGVTDTQAVDVLLSACLPAGCTGMKRPWVILETDYPNRDTAGAWFSLGGGCEGLTVRSLAVPRVSRSQAAETMLQAWIGMRRTDAPGVWVDAEWRRLPASGRGAGLLMATHSYAILLAMCVRLRMTHPKSSQACLLNRDADATELARLTRRVLDIDLRRSAFSAATAAALAPLHCHGEQQGNVTLVHGIAAPLHPPSFLYWCELLQKLCPIQTDWEALTGNLAAIARGIAMLYGDGRPPDWRAAERVMRDTVPYMTGWLLEQCALLRSGGKSRHKEFIAAGAQIDTYVKRELKRLRAHGIVTERINYSMPTGYAWHPWRFRIANADYRTLADRTQRILT